MQVDRNTGKLSPGRNEKSLSARSPFKYFIFYPPWRDHPDGDPLWGPNLISFSFNVPLEKSFLISKVHWVYRFFWFTHFFIVTDGWWWMVVVVDGRKKSSPISLKIGSVIVQDK